MKKAFAVFMTVCLCALFVPQAIVQSGHALAASKKGEEFVPDELLVQFRKDADESEINDAKARIAALTKRELREGNGGKGRLELESIRGGVTVADAIALLKDHPAVEIVEPNWIYRHAAVSNDPFYVNNQLFGMYGDLTTPANQFGSQAGEAWAAGFTGSNGVIVGVIDEGIDLNHPDLAANIWTNPFDPVDGIDNDGNGKIDDVHGWDFANNDNTIFDGAAGSTVDQHGTHVSGTIGGVGGNGIGVAGVNWNVTIISGKFLGPNGGTTADAVSAVDYFTDLKTRHGMNIVALNNSWGGGGFSQALADAITRAAKADILFIAAAGNGDVFGRGLNNDTTASYPSNYNTTVGSATEPAASYDSVIAVAAIDSTGAKASFSNYGATTVDLGAPGVAVNSTTPGNTYSSFSGTSMATPHVTGAAALYASINPGSSALAIRNAILDAARATPTASMAGITVTGGRLNVGGFAPVGPPPLPPAAPAGLSATAVSSNQINLAWADNPDETGYKVERCTGSAATCLSFTQIGQTGANVTSFSDTTAAASTTYTYHVIASNAGGASLPSNPAEATTPAPPPVPADPSGLTANGVSRTQVNLAWTDNSANEDGFKIERCTNAGCTNFAQVATVGANVRTFSNTGLVRRTTYRFRVRAFNASGNSGYSNIADGTTTR
jgi:subtilisin family serine protease